MQNYIGTKLIKAEPMEKDGKHGYQVKYDNGYVSWSPKEVFEKAYFKIDGDNKLSSNDISRFVLKYEDSKIGQKTTMVTATLINGFEITESSSCICPENYDHEIGVEYCKKLIEDKIWMLVGFLLQTALNGVKLQERR